MDPSIEYIVAVAVLQRGGTASEADAVWRTIQNQPVPCLPSEFIYDIDTALAQVRGT